MQMFIPFRYFTTLVLLYFTQETTKFTTLKNTLKHHYIHFIEELLIFNVFIYSYCHLFNNLLFCKYYINIILQRVFACCKELMLSKANRTEVHQVSLFS
jgi:hypothetical protein